MAVFSSDVAVRDKRSQLRVLDACLTHLEEAHERDESRISQALASRLAPHVPDLRPGMLIADAIERVLQEQEPYLCADPERPRDAGKGPARGGGETPAPATLAPLDEVQARDLTRRIRDAAGDVCLLILEAHRRNATAALGYRSWEHYVRKEFSMSRRRSYELLDQAQVVLAIKERVPLNVVPQISPFVAGYIKSHLDDVVGEIRLRLAEGPHASQELAVKRVIDAERKRFADARRRRFESRLAAAAPAGGKPRWDSRRFWQAIEALASLPPVTEVAPYPGPGTSRQEAQLARVAAWLAALVDRLEERVA